MAEAALKPLNALGRDTPALDRLDGVTIRENPDLAMASVALRMGREADAAKSAESLLGFALPGPGAMAAKGDWAAFWTGPGQWMVTAPEASHADIAAIVKAGLGDAASVTEQSGGWVRFEVEGPQVIAVMERLSNVDVQVMRSGQATRCQIEHLGTFLLCQRAGEAFSVLTLRSAAASMHHALVTAAKSL